MVDTPAKSANELTVGMLAQRLDGNDEAIRLLQASMDKMPTPALVEADVNALREITAERFKGVADIFAERKTGVESALTAQKESAAKTEKNFGEQINQTAQNLKSEVGSLQNQINDAKTRLTAVESRTTVTKEVSGDGRIVIFAIIGALTGAGALLVAVFGMLRTTTGT